MLAPWKARDRALSAQASATPVPHRTPEDELLAAFRAHRAGAALPPAAAQHLATMLKGWKADPTAVGVSFDDWLRSLPTLNIRARTLPTSVIMAIADPHAHFVPPPA